MGRMEDSIKMNYMGNMLTVFTYVGFYNPHACILIRLITTTRIPLDCCTWMDTTSAIEREKLLDTCYIQAAHTILTGVGVNKDSVIARALFPPIRCCMNTF